MISVNLNVLAWLQPPDWSRAQQEINSLHTVLTVLLFHQFHILRIYHMYAYCFITLLRYTVCTNMSPYFIPHRISYLLYCNPSILLFPRMSPLSLFLFSVHTHWNSSLFLLIFPFNTFFKYFPNSFFAFHSFLFLHFLLYFWPSLF